MRGCERGADGVLRAGAAAVDITPPWFEKVRPEYLDRADCPNGQERCGTLRSPISFKDCGTDMICPQDAGWPGPDPDGTEGDDVLDFFRDCGKDDLCPGDPGYPGPDEGEGNGRFDGYWIAGFGNNRPAQGVHDPIWARAFAVQNGDVTVAWVVVDTVGFFWNNLDNPPDDPLTVNAFPEQAHRPGIRQRVAALAPDLDIDYVIAGSTHTHEAPDTMGQWGFADGFRQGGLPTRRGVDDEWLFGTVIEGAARAIVEAVRSMRPARAHAAEARTGYDNWVHDSRSPIVFDDTVQVLRLADAATDETIATVVGWGSHPEVLWSDNNLVTSDFVHFVREGVERGLPAAGDAPALPGLGGVCVYVQGPLGGLIGPGRIPIRDRAGVVHEGYTFARARANGENLAAVVLEAIAAAPPLDETAIEFAGEVIELPIDNTIFKVAALAFDLFKRPYYHFDPRLPDSETNRPWIRSEVAVLRLGRVTFVTTPGELFPELSVGFDEPWRRGPFAREGNPNPPDPSKIPALSPGPYLKELGGGDVTFVTSLTFDEVGYIVPSYDFEVSPDIPYIFQAEGDHYEETNSLGPETAPIVLDAIRRLVRWSPPPPR